MTSSAHDLTLLATVGALSLQLLPSPFLKSVMTSSAYDITLLATAGAISTTPSLPFLVKCDD